MINQTSSNSYKSDKLKIKHFKMAPNASKTFYDNDVYLSQRDLVNLVGQIIDVNRGTMRNPYMLVLKQACKDDPIIEGFERGIYDLSNYFVAPKCGYVYMAFRSGSNPVDVIVKTFYEIIYLMTSLDYLFKLKLKIENRNTEEKRRFSENAKAYYFEKFGDVRTFIRHFIESVTQDLVILKRYDVALYVLSFMGENLINNFDIFLKFYPFFKNNFFQIFAFNAKELFSVAINNKDKKMIDLIVNEPKFKEIKWDKVPKAKTVPKSSDFEIFSILFSRIPKYFSSLEDFEFETSDSRISNLFVYAGLCSKFTMVGFETFEDMRPVLDSYPFENYFKSGRSFSLNDAYKIILVKDNFLCPINLLFVWIKYFDFIQNRDIIHRLINFSYRDLNECCKISNLIFELYKISILD